MKGFLISLGLLSALLMGPVRADQRHGDAEVITFGSEGIPGVEAIADYERQGRGDSSKAADSANPSEGALTAVAVVPHTCAPVFGRGGVSLSYSFSDAGAGDCVTFAPPPPLERIAGRPVATTVSPEQLALAAFDRARSVAGTPSLQIAPGGVGLTGLTSYFWLAAEPRPVIASAQAGGLVVTAEAYPIQYEWGFGDGSQRTTSHSGRPWRARRAGNVPHRYGRVATYDVEVEIIWEARWRIGSGAWQRLGYFSTTDGRAYPVRQLIPFLVRSRR